ncbi:MAG: IS21-like element helper ATPase IstB [Phascolarctobacterium sp.]|nr:IS21-like element helper ATPase IstB [Phascolarctobacterium sp.]
MSYGTIVNGLERLGIQKMQLHLDTYIDLVNKGEKTFAQALEELISIEEQSLRERAINACVRVANFPFLKGIDDFEFNFEPNINKTEILDLASLRFLEKNENILLVGTSDVEKTHLATALGIEAAKNRVSTYFITFEALMSQLKKALVENRLESKMKQYTKYKLLIIDEIGYLPIDKDSANLFFQLIAKRYEKHSTIITTNTVFSKWGDIFGSAMLANAILDRLLHHSVVISIKGPSCRLREKQELLEKRNG